MRRSLASMLSLAASVSFVSLAHAEPMTIKQPGAHPSYVLELEPHFILGYPGIYGPEGLPGVGGRFTLGIVSNGFVSSINNSVGIGVGVDAVFPSSKPAFVLVPVVLQWNFWLTQHWSVFGEPGIVISSEPSSEHVVWPTIAAGGRFHLADRLAITARVGMPSISVGLSLLL